MIAIPAYETSFVADDEIDFHRPENLIKGISLQECETGKNFLFYSLYQIELGKTYKTPQNCIVKRISDRELVVEKPGIQKANGVKTSRPIMINSVNQNAPVTTGKSLESTSPFYMMNNTLQGISISNGAALIQSCSSGSSKGNASCFLEGGD